MLVEESDLTSAARIRNAALHGFADNGVAATSVRDVATAAGVSAGLVQHHFKTKAQLRQAVDDYVLRVVTEAFGDFGTSSGSGGDLLDELGERIVAVVRDHNTALRYVVRSVAEGDRAALGIFDAFIAVADALNDRLAEEGVLREDLDRRWASLHGVVLNLATVLFEPAISRHLEGSFFSPAELDRWNEASKALFRKGIYSNPSSERKPTGAKSKPTRRAAAAKR